MPHRSHILESTGDVVVVQRSMLSVIGRIYCSVLYVVCGAEGNLSV